VKAGDSFRVGPDTVQVIAVNGDQVTWRWFGGTRAYTESREAFRRRFGR